MLLIDIIINSHDSGTGMHSIMLLHSLVGCSWLFDFIFMPPAYRKKSFNYYYIKIYRPLKPIFCCCKYSIAVHDFFLGHHASWQKLTCVYSALSGWIHACCRKTGQLSCILFCLSPQEIFLGCKMAFPWGSVKF